MQTHTGKLGTSPKKSPQNLSFGYLLKYNLHVVKCTPLGHTVSGRVTSSFHCVTTVWSGLCMCHQSREVPGTCLVSPRREGSGQGRHSWGGGVGGGSLSPSWRLSHVLQAGPTSASSGWSVCIRFCPWSHNNGRVLPWGRLEAEMKRPLWLCSEPCLAPPAARRSRLSRLTCSS